MTGVAATRTLPIELFSARFVSSCCWLCVRDSDGPGAGTDAVRSSPGFFLLNLVVMVTSNIVARLRSAFGPMLSERDRSRFSCSSDIERERERERRSAPLSLSLPLSLPLTVADVTLDPDPAVVVDFRRFAAGLGDRGGESPSESWSEVPASGKSFEWKSAQSSGSFVLNLNASSISPRVDYGRLTR